MKRFRFASGSDYLAKTIFVALACGVIPLIFVHGVWGKLLQKVYLLTVVLFFAVLWGYWGSTDERWFWKAMAPIVLIHSVIVFGIAKVNLAFPGIDELPGIVYSGLGFVLTGEILGSRWVIERCRARKQHRQKVEDNSGPGGEAE